MDKGAILESGSHAELMKKEDGVYRSLVEAQSLKQKEQKGNVMNITTNEAEIVPTNPVYEEKPTLAVAEKSETKVMIPIEEVEKKKSEKYMMRFLKLNYPEWGIMCLGAIGAAVNGGINSNSKLKR